MGKTRARATTAGITLDTGALIALDRADKRMIALLGQALAQRRNLRIPAGVVGQAWRDDRIQVALARFLRTDEVEIIPLDEHTSPGRAGNSAASFSAGGRRSILGRECIRIG